MQTATLNAAKAVVYLASFFGILLITAAACSWLMRPWTLDIYSQRFSFLPGQWFGEKIARTIPRQQDTCLIIGVSNTREGFDPAIMQASSATQFINAGTTGGNNEVLEIQTAILKRFNVRPKCIVAGISMWMMFRQGSPPLVAEEYIGLIGWPEVMGFSNRPLFSKEGIRIALALGLPLKAQSRQLNRIIRAALHQLRGAVLGSLPLSRYELFPEELKPSNDYLYFGMAPWLAAKRDQIIKDREPWYQPSLYGDPQQDTSFRRALDNMLQLTDRVVLIHMPTTYIFDAASKWGAPHVRRVIDSYSDRIQTIDCSNMRDESLFVDEGHLTEKGREILSKEVASLLMTTVTGTANGVATLCIVGRL